MSDLRTYKVSVTQEHIRKGSRHDCSSCPIALALKDMFPGRHVFVDIISMRVGRHNSYGHCDLTHEFMKDFDNGKPVEPFDFLMVGQDIGEPR